MIQELEYEYDENAYKGRLQKVLQESKTLRKQLAKASYEDFEKLEARKNRVERQIQNLIDELEVEHFLTYGPMGTDPLDKQPT